MIEENEVFWIRTLSDLESGAAGNLDLVPLLIELYNKHKDQQILIDSLQQQIDDLRG